MEEYWDLYDKERNKLNKIIKRGDKLNENEFHLVTNAWIINDKSEFLITQRNSTKKHPFMWECTGGSVLTKEDTLIAAKREVKEELGIDIDISKAKKIGSILRYYPNCNDILDVWLFNSNVKIEEVKIQEEEVMDVMWASKEQIMDLYNNNKFEANAFFKEVMNI